MNIFSRNNFFPVCFISLLVLLTGCSESDKEEIELPPIVERHQFFYIQNATLYDFDPETGLSSAVTAIEDELSEDKNTTVIYSDINMMLALDVDSSTIANNSGQNGSFVDHSIIEEYVAYVKNQALYVYDLTTRFNHNVGKLPDQLYFCDIRKVQYFDKNPREEDVVLIKDEASVYVKASTEEACTENFSYFRAYFQEDPNVDRTYERRTIKLLEHTHNHTHEHDDSEHDHDHLYDEGHIDENGNIFNPKNHEHGHSHEHTLQYGSHVEHDYLTQEEIDEVHNDPNFREFVSTEHTSLRASFRSAEEALMYSATPISLGEDRSRFGYLGYESTSNCLKFFEYDTTNGAAEDPLRDNIWSINLDDPSNFINQSCTQIEDAITSHQILAPLDTGDGIAVKINTTLYYLPYEAIFEDDDTAARASAIRSPLIEGTDIDMVYSSLSNNLAIRSGLSVYALANPGVNFTPTLLRTYNSDEIDQIEISFPAQKIFVYKTFTGANCNSSGELPCTSLVRLNLTNGSEETAIVNSSYQEKFLTVPSHGVSLFHNALPETNEITSFVIDDTGTQGYFTPSMWGLLFDQREVITENTSGSMSAKSDIVVTNDNGDLVLDKPEIWLEHGASQTFDLAGTLPTSVFDPIESTVVNDFFGYVSIKESSALDSPTKTFFFPTGRSYINPTGEFGDMKLMYQSIPQSEPSE